MVTARRKTVVVQAVSPEAKRRDSALGKAYGNSINTFAEDRMHCVILDTA